MVSQVIEENTWLRSSVNITKNISEDGKNEIDKTYIKSQTNYKVYPSQVSMANPSG